MLDVNVGTEGVCQIQPTTTTTGAGLAQQSRAPQAGSGTLHILPRHHRLGVEVCVGTTQHNKEKTTGAITTRHLEFDNFTLNFLEQISTDMTDALPYIHWSTILFSQCFRMNNDGNWPNTVSESMVSNTKLSDFLALTELSGENSVSSSQPIIIISVPNRADRFFCRAHRVPADQKNSRKLWRSRRRKSMGRSDGGADFPAAIVVAGKCPNLRWDSIACCRKIGVEFSPADSLLSFLSRAQ